VIAGSDEEKVGLPDTKEDEEHKDGTGQCDVGGIDLAFGKRAKEAEMVIGGAVLVECLMQEMGRRQGGCDQEQQSQQTGQCLARHHASGLKCSCLFHSYACNQAQQTRTGKAEVLICGQI